MHWEKIRLDNCKGIIYEGSALFLESSCKIRKNVVINFVNIFSFSILILKVTFNVYTACLFKMYFSTVSLNTKEEALVNFAPSLSPRWRFTDDKKPQIQDGKFKVAIATEGDRLFSMSLLSALFLFHLNINSRLYSLR